MRGINVFGFQVPTDQVRLCFFDEAGVMIADKRVKHIGRTRNGNTVLVTDKGQAYGNGVAEYKQLRLNRTNAEKLYPMTPELKVGQNVVESVLDTAFIPRSQRIK